jgi:4-amino-4-deoxy-L-arabinose transferase-like glycosyltransferase
VHDRGPLLTLPALHPRPAPPAGLFWVGAYRYLLAFAALAAGYLALATWLPPTDDELYYWCWSRQLQLSYFDHPPMTALMIRASTAVFGHTAFAVRLPACLSTLAVFAVVAWLSRPRRLLPWVAATPLFTFGAVLITPDTPLLLFWSVYLGWLVVAHRRMELAPVPLWLWAVGGVLLGCGALGKYTVALAVPAGFLSFLLTGRRWREWLPGYMLHGFISFLFALPVLAFNLRHDFAPLRFQWQHAMSAGGGLWPFAEFVGIQLLLFGTLPVVLFPWVVGNLRTLAADPRLRVCACLYAVPFTFFLYKALRGPLEGNWALACYVGFWPVAAHWYERVRPSPRWRWATTASFALPLGCVAVLAIHLLVEPLPVLRPRQDRLTRFGARDETFRAVAEAIRGHGEPLPVYAPSYQSVAQLRFHGVDARQIDGATRPSNFTLRPERLTDVDRAYVVSECTLPDHLAPGFDPPHVVAALPLTVRGEKLTYYLVFLYTRSKTDCKVDHSRNE